MSGGPADQWFLRTRGKVLGPFALRQLEVLRNQGRLAKFDEVSRGDRRSWVVASTVAELFPSETITEWADPAPPDDVSFPVGDPPASTKPAQALWHYLGTQGASAPVELSELRRLASTGAITAETLVWTAEMPDWAPAGTVPVLGLSAPPVRSAPYSVDLQATPAASADGPPRSGGGAGYSVAGFILGLVGLLCGVVVCLVIIPSAVVSAVRSSSAGLIGLVLLGMTLTWAVCGLLAVILGSIGLAKATRDEKRRGLGLGIAALVLGMLATAGLVLLGLLILLGALTLKG